jgi:hypothetical protein
MIKIFKLTHCTDKLYTHYTTCILNNHSEDSTSKDSNSKVFLPVQQNNQKASPPQSLPLPQGMDLMLLIKNTAAIKATCKALMTKV